MQSIASAGVRGSHEFCKEIHRVTQGHVKYTNDNNNQDDSQEDSMLLKKLKCELMFSVTC